MQFGQIDKLILFGGSYLMAELVRVLRSSSDNQQGMVVFSATRHLDEVIGGEPLKTILEKHGVRYFATDDINTDARLKDEVTSSTLGIALGAAWVFEEPTVELFAEHHLLDFMGIDLPRYRGGAHYTWAILHGNKKGCANLQVILGGEETFHRGPIVAREECPVPESAKTPKDYFDFMVKKEAVFIQSFLHRIKQGEEFPLQQLDESKSSYYPFLHTKSHGLIDWRWQGKEIARFINAFDDPYPGASTFVGGKKIFLKTCTVLPAPETYHPFTSGVVVRKDESKDESNVYVATLGNLLQIKTVLDEDGNDVKNEIALGVRLYTPSTELDKAMCYAAVYDAKGLKQ